jgi:hypothetical protein
MLYLIYKIKTEVRQVKNLEYIKKNNWDDNKEAVLNFAVACYETNTIEELKKDLEPDETDMKEWGIDADQWRLAIECALGELESEEE